MERTTVQRRAGHHLLLLPKDLLKICVGFLSDFDQSQLANIKTIFDIIVATNSRVLTVDASSFINQRNLCKRWVERLASINKATLRHVVFKGLHGLDVLEDIASPDLLGITVSIALGSLWPQVYAIVGSCPNLVDLLVTTHRRLRSNELASVLEKSRPLHVLLALD